MLARFVLWALFLFLIVRTIRRFFGGIAQGAAPRQRPPAPSTPDKGELMVRDPVCGTFVLPS
ncbi:MAG: hypothetical protein NTY02_07975, partial [Acidobacteria bacterium]|nr:hypothetical protein [Acidobacteriota bacterium]